MASITSIIIPGSIKNISHFVFEGCLFFKEATIKEGVAIIGCGSFNRCEELEIIIYLKVLNV